MIFTQTAFSYENRKFLLPSSSAMLKLESPFTTPISLGIDEQENIRVFERATKSVVFITNTALRRDFW